jgi:hypothetical protein
VRLEIALVQREAANGASVAAAGAGAALRPVVPAPVVAPIPVAAALGAGRSTHAGRATASTPT